MSDSTRAIQNCARWTGLVSAVLALVLGIVHICGREASLSFPSSTRVCYYGGYTYNNAYAGGSSKFTDDWCNSLSWRSALFSFAPSIFVDNWTPFFMGVIGILVHFEQYKCDLIVRSFVNYMIFHALVALWGMMGYDGGLGIIFSIAAWLCVLLSLIAALLEDRDAYLYLNQYLKRR